MEKWEHSCTVGENGNWCSHSEKVWSFLRKLKIELPYNPAIALLGIYPKDTGVQIRRDTCTPMFTAALSTAVEVWKEPKCPSKDKWIQMWYR